MASPLDLYWLAGFLEGEGSFPTCKDHGVRVTAAQVQREPLERCQRIAGGNIHFMAKVQKPTHSPKYVWEVNGTIAVGLSMTLYRIMSPKRKLQISVALSHWKQGPTAHKYKRACPRGHSYRVRYLPKQGRTRRYCPTCQNDRERLKSVKARRDTRSLVLPFPKANP